METLRRLFTLRRLRNIFCIASFVAAGVAAFGLIGSLRAITQDGSGPRQDYAGSRVHTSTAGATPRPTPLCQGPCSLEIVLSEDFDNVAPPTLPPDWLAPMPWDRRRSGSSNSGLPMPRANTSPNAAFVDDPGVVSDKRLHSLQLPRASVQLIFQQNFNLEASDVDPNVGFDGGVLEMSTGGGNTFQDILAVGGSFVMGGYNRITAADRGSPIAGRQAWSGNSQGFTTTVVNLPFSLGVGSSAGEWPAITVAPAKAGALTPSISVGANRFRVSHRLLDLALRRHHALCGPHRQALKLRPRLLRHLAQARDTRSERPAFRRNALQQFAN
jgi:hypothetical protein